MQSNFEKERIYEKNQTAPWGALFDLDGVLVDTEGIYTEFWHSVDVLYPTGVERFEYVIKGNTLETILSKYFKAADHPAILEMLAEHERTMVYRPFDGTRRFLAELRAEGVPSAIVTSSSRLKMRNLFEALPWLRDAVDIIITGDDVVNSKPDPEGYRLAAERLGLDSSRCVVFEDSMAGVEAGRRAGGKVVGIATTNPASRLEPLSDMVVDFIDDLTVEAVAELLV